MYLEQFLRGFPLIRIFDKTFFEEIIELRRPDPWPDVFVLFVSTREYLSNVPLRGILESGWWIFRYLHHRRHRSNLV